MNKDISKVLFTQEQIAGRIKEMAKRISVDYQGKSLTLIGILKGSVIFMSDLMRALDIPCEIDFMAVSSYGKGAVTSGAVKILKDLDTSVEGKDIIIVEDILDSGVTLGYIIELMEARKPSSVRLCTLLDKPERRRVPVKVDYSGFSVPDEFIVGYGLDYAEKYRNLPYIGVLDKSIYQG